MEEKTFHPIPSCDCANDVKRSLRDLPPAHYTLEINSFSDLKKMLKESGQKCYESQTFDAVGYKWKLSLYPNGDEERNGKGYISMYLMIEETHGLPLGWEVYASLKMFVFDHIHDKFLIIQDAFERVRRFHRMKTEWGFAQLLPLSDFHDTNNGYLMLDKCVFGVEISVSSSVRGERLMAMENFDSSYTWKICEFSSLKDESHYSESFTLANVKWKLQLHPKGNSDGAGKYLSLFLYLEESNATDRVVYAAFKLTILDQRNNKDRSNTGRHWFTPGDGWGWDKFMSLGDISDASKGFVVNDTLKIKNSNYKSFYSTEFLLRTSWCTRWW